jgi:hypothetical protein
MISMKSFADELEKIAVSPSWITGKLTGMAKKVPEGFTSGAFKSRLESSVSRNLAAGSAHAKTNPMYSNLSARPTTSKFQNAAAKFRNKSQKLDAVDSGVNTILNKTGSVYKEAGMKDKLLGMGAAASLASGLGTAGYAGRHEYKAMAGGALDAARNTRQDVLRSLKSKKIGNMPVLKGK